MAEKKKRDEDGDPNALRQRRKGRNSRDQKKKVGSFIHLLKKHRFWDRGKTRGKKNSFVCWRRGGIKHSVLFTKREENLLC